MALMLLLGAGCVAPDAEAAQATIPWPGAGSIVDYVGDQRLSVEVLPAREIQDAAGSSVDVAVLRYRTASGSGSVIAEEVEFLDADGRLTLALSPCSNRIHSPGLSCKAERRAFGTYYQWSMYGALGMSWAWGHTLMPGEREVVYAVGGDTIRVRYALTAQSDDCLRGVTHENVRLFLDQSYAPHVGIPVSFTICDGESFARQITLEGSDLGLARIEATAGAPPRGRGTPLHEVPVHPEARTATPVLADATWSPSHFSLDRAWTFVANEHEPSRRFIHENGNGFARYASTFLSSEGSVAPSGMVPALETTRTSATITIETRSGATARIGLNQTCALSRCEIAADPLVHLDSAPSLPPEAEAISVPLPAIFDQANRTLGGPPTSFGVGTVLRGVSAPDTPSGGRVLATMLALPSGKSFGVPHRVVIDGASLRIVLFDLPWPRAEELTGVDLGELLGN